MDVRRGNTISHAARTFAPLVSQVAKTFRRCPKFGWPGRLVRHMNGFTRDSVVDQLASTLAERRHNSIGRRTAYLALARAILMDDVLDDMFGWPERERQPAEQAA